MSKFILTADWHLRSTVPEYRKDDFLMEQYRKVKFILETAKERESSIIIAGDIGDKPHWENWLLNRYIRLLKRHPLPIYVIPGQHDLPNHRIDKIEESGIKVLANAGAITLIDTSEVLLLSKLKIALRGFPYGEKIRTISSCPNYKTRIAIIHRLIVQKKSMKWQKGLSTARILLKKYSHYDLIVSGDNHESFIEEYEGRFLANPGSIMRLTTAQINHKPKIYLWSSSERVIIPIEIPIEKDVFDLKKREKEIEINKEIERFVDMLTNPKSNEHINFTDYLNQYLNSNKIGKEVKEKLWEVIN